jgi:hypothetical protein
MEEIQLGRSKRITFKIYQEFRNYNGPSNKSTDFSRPWDETDWKLEKIQQEH